MSLSAEALLNYWKIGDKGSLLSFFSFKCVFMITVLFTINYSVNQKTNEEGRKKIFWEIGVNLSGIEKRNGIQLLDIQLLNLN